MLSKHMHILSYAHLYLRLRIVQWPKQLLFQHCVWFEQNVVHLSTVANTAFHWTPNLTFNLVITEVDISQYPSAQSDFWVKCGIVQPGSHSGFWSRGEWGKMSQWVSGPNTYIWTAIQNICHATLNVVCVLSIFIFFFCGRKNQN